MSFLSLVTVFLIRMVPVALFWATRRRIVATDVMYHICSARFMRNNHHRPIMRLPRTFDSGENYPWLYSWLLSFVPERAMMPVAMVIGPLCDALLFAVILASFSWFGVPLSESGVWTLTLLYVFTPHMIRPKSGKVVPQPRSVSALIGNVIVVVLLMHALTDRIPFYGLALGLFALIALLSRFGLQATVLYPIVLGIMIGDIWVLSFPIVAFVSSVIVTGGMTWSLIAGHYRHTQLYWRKFYYVVKDYNTLHWPKSFDRRELFRTAYRLSDNAYFLTITGLPLLLPISIFLWRKPVDAGHGILASWLIAGFLIMLITSCGKLKVIGQAERYLDYAVVPYFMLGYLSLQTLPAAVFWGVLAYGVLAFLGYCAVYLKYFGVDPEKLAGLEEGYQWLNSLDGRKTVLSIPYAYSRLGLILTDHDYPCAQGWASHQWDYLDEIYAPYPYPPSDLAPVLRRYNVDLVVKIKGAGERSGNAKSYVSLTDELKVFENQYVEIFGVQSSPAIARV